MQEGPDIKNVYNCSPGVFVIVLEVYNLKAAAPLQALSEVLSVVKRVV